MTRTDFKDAYRMSRQTTEALRIFHNGRWYSLSRGHCDRLAGTSWTYDRPRGAQVAMTIDSVGFMRRRLRIACHASLAMARQYQRA